MTYPVVDTVFVPGTTITHEWLNGVNDYVNESNPADHSAANVTYDPPFTNSVATNVEAKLAQTVNVKDFGAIGDDVTNDTLAFTNALSYAKANNVELTIPSGTYLLTSGVLNFGAANLHIRGLGKPTLHFIGTGKGLELNPPPTPGYFAGQTIENLVIVGGSGITHGVYTNGFVRGTMRNIEVQEVTQQAFSINGSVSCLFDSLKYSASSHTNTATYGIYLAGAGIPAINFTADCTFLNCVSEDFNGDSVYIYEGSGNTFIGGTYEGCDKGLVISSTSRLNNFDSVWFELNATMDVEVAGTSNSFNNCNFSSNSTLLNIQVSTGKDTTIFGGYVRAATVQSSSSDTLFVGNAFDQNTGGTLGIQGTGTYKCFGLTKVDNSGLVVGIMPDVLGESGSFTGTATGLTTTVTASIQYNRLGNQVTLRLPEFSGTSNATTFTITGMPTLIKPTFTETCLVRVRDNSGTITIGVAEISSSGVITLYSTPGLGTWTSSGTKALFATDITYYR